MTFLRPEANELYNQLELLDDQRATGELGWDEATEQMDKLRAEHPEANALLRREAEGRYRRTGTRNMALDEAATPKDRVITQYQQVLRAQAIAQNAQCLLAAMLAVLTDEERAELDPAITASVAEAKTGTA